MWSGIQRRITSPAFKRGDLTAIMGGIEVDLRQAGDRERRSGDRRVRAVGRHRDHRAARLGGLESRSTPIMGGAEDKSTGTQARAQPADRPRVRHHGRRRDQDLVNAMHPILGDRQRLRLHLIGVGARRRDARRCSCSALIGVPWSDGAAVRAADGPDRRAGVALGLVSLPGDAARRGRARCASASRRVGGRGRDVVAVGGARALWWQVLGRLGVRAARAADDRAVRAARRARRARRTCWR